MCCLLQFFWAHLYRFFWSKIVCEPPTPLPSIFVPYPCPALALPPVFILTLWPPFAHSSTALASLPWLWRLSPTCLNQLCKTVTPVDTFPPLPAFLPFSLDVVLSASASSPEFDSCFVSWCNLLQLCKLWPVHQQWQSRRSGKAAASFGSHLAAQGFVWLSVHCRAESAAEAQLPQGNTHGMHRQWITC